MKKYIIGVDIGGTKIAAGIVDVKGRLVKDVVLPTLPEKGKKASLDQVMRSIERVLLESGVSKRSVRGIGLCAPGPLNPEKGIVHNPPNLPGWREVKLAELVGKRFALATRVENDANAAGIAEMIWGAAKGYKDIFYVTVSTGIGTGIIIDGRIYHGKNGMAGEGGHVTINYDDKDALCGCGHIGCIEAIASGPHTVRRLRNRMKRTGAAGTLMMNLAGGDMEKITMKTVEEAARKKDKLAMETVRDEGHLLGLWLGGMINILDPEIIVIGGGVSMMGEMLFSEIRRSAAEHSINIFAKKTPIVRAKLMRNAGIYGAASLFMA